MTIINRLSKGEEKYGLAVEGVNSLPLLLVIYLSVLSDGLCIKFTY